MSTTLWRNARLATLAGTEPWGWIERGALLSEGPTIRWVGDDSALPAGLQPDREIDLGGALLTPGLVDCHTHLVYGGQRAREFELRLQGASYEQIARAGGGIRSTVAATRAASDDAAVRVGPRARADADGRGRDHAGDQVRLRPERRARGALPAHRAPSGQRTAADGAHHLPVGARAAAGIRRPRRRLHRRRVRLAAGAARRRPGRRGRRLLRDTSPSRRRRRGACSRRHALWACR